MKWRHKCNTWIYKNQLKNTKWGVKKVLFKGGPFTDITYLHRYLVIPIHQDTNKLRFKWVAFSDEIRVSCPQCVYVFGFFRLKNLKANGIISCFRYKWIKQGLKSKWQENDFHFCLNLITSASVSLPNSPTITNKRNPGNQRSGF